ncbi:hypothetical protein ACX9NE_00705 [Mycobacterium sp. ML4]
MLTVDQFDDRVARNDLGGGVDGVQAGDGVVLGLAGIEVIAG